MAFSYEVARAQPAAAVPDDVVTLTAENRYGTKFLLPMYFKFLFFYVKCNSHLDTIGRYR